MEVKQRKKNQTTEAEVVKKKAEEVQSAPKAKGKSLEESREMGYKVLIFVATLLALITRFWMIHHPGEVVFDEVHFGKFASFYLRGEYYFDVHPPFGKMLIALVGHLVGYEGHFLFDKIGDDYAENNVPYIALRLWTAGCGAAIVPFAILIMKEVGVSVTGASLGACFLVFDTALTTQCRLILLDSMLMLFCTMAVYFWIKFHSIRHKDFSVEWWFWLAMTGVGLAMVLGVKLVGLFTVATVGIATLVDLWELLDHKRGHSMGYFWKQFCARALCLILLPIILYLIPFYIHFKLLPNSGPGDKFMSLRFQEQLVGNSITANSTAVMYNSNVTFQHFNSKFYLHSHVHLIPLRHESGRVSSNGQQVNAYGYSDANSVWNIQPVDPELYPDPYELTEEEKERGVRYIRNKSVFRLQHVSTGNYLCTHDVASPLTTTNMEVIAIDDEKSQSRYNDTVWRIDIGERETEPKKIKSKKDPLYIASPKYNIALFTDKKSILPDWGFKMQEINGNKKMYQSSNQWMFASVEHPNIVDGLEIGEEARNTTENPPSFLSKFFELQGKMIAHNNALTKSHPYSSAPITWPFVVRGISFWEKKEGLKQIYLLGNPVAWWISIAGPFLYAGMWIIDRIFLRRGIDDFGPAVRNWWDRAIGFLTLAWLLHWVPFFMMGRMLFLHHYMPAYIFSTIQTATLIDFLARNFSAKWVHLPRNTRMATWQRTKSSYSYILFVTVLIAATIGSFYYFSPLCYGLGFPDLETLRAHKWFSTWDLQYA